MTEGHRNVDEREQSGDSDKEDIPGGHPPPTALLCYKDHSHCLN